MTGEAGGAQATSVSARWQRLAADGTTIRRLVVTDFFLVLAALLAVVAIGDPGGGGGHVFVDRGFGLRAGGDHGGWQGSTIDDPVISGSGPGESGAVSGGSVIAPPAPAGGTGDRLAPLPSPGAVPGGGSGVRVELGPTSPPRDGRYRQKVTTTSNGQTDEEEDEATYRTTSRTGGETRQTVDGGESGRFMMPSVNGGSQRLVWRSSGLSVVQRSPDDPPGSGCDPEEYLVLQLPLRKDAAWRASSACTFGFGGAFGGSVRTDSRSKVVDSSVVTVAGRQVAVWVIENVTTFDGQFTTEDGTERVEGVINQTMQFAPSVGLFVRVSGTYQATGPDGEERGTFQVEALNLDPL